MGEKGTLDRGCAVSKQSAKSGDKPAAKSDPLTRSGYVLFLITAGMGVDSIM
jgi:hypothetical protein